MKNSSYTSKQNETRRKAQAKLSLDSQKVSPQIDSVIDTRWIRAGNQVFQVFSLQFAIANSQAGLTIELWVQTNHRSGFGG